MYDSSVKLGLKCRHVERIGGHPLITYASEEGEWRQVPYTFILLITCKKGSRGSR